MILLPDPAFKFRNFFSAYYHFITFIRRQNQLQSGVTVQQFVPDILWITAPLAVSLSIVLMQITKTLHPPGGATALIAVTGSTQIKNLGYWYVLNPVLSGVLILLIVALIPITNISTG